MVQLDEVFGIAASIPQYTYVDRASLDKTFKYLLSGNRHIVIHGASKQGKTILRKKNLQGEQCLPVQCRYNWTLEQIYLEILRLLGIQIPTEITKSFTIGAEGKGKASAGIKVPYPTPISLKVCYVLSQIHPTSRQARFSVLLSTKSENLIIRCYSTDKLCFCSLFLK